MALIRHPRDGHAMCLADEVANFNIQVVSFDIETFRTTILDSSKMKRPVSQNEDYEPILQSVLERIGRFSGKQPEDSKLGIKGMVYVLKGEGERVPVRIAIGADAVVLIKKKCEEMLGVVEEWQDLSGITNFGKLQTDIEQN